MEDILTMRTLLRLVPAALLSATLLAAAAGTIATAGPAARTHTTESTTMTTDWIEPPLFATAPLDTEQDHACIPATDGYDAQVHIAAPKRVQPRADGVFSIPVCMRGIIPVSQGMAPPTIYARDTATGKRYEGIAYIRQLPGQGPHIHADIIPNSRPKPGPIPPGVRTAQQFTTDLAARAKLPRQSATYEVYIIAGGVQSESATVEVTF